MFEWALAYFLLGIFFSANDVPWPYTRVPVEEIIYVEALPQALPAFVNPWTVEYLPNPVIFSTAVAMYAG
jgi:hypothetical protein